MTRAQQDITRMIIEFGGAFAAHNIRQARSRSRLGDAVILAALGIAVSEVAITGGGDTFILALLQQLRT